MTVLMPEIPENFAQRAAETIFLALAAFDESKSCAFLIAEQAEYFYE